MRVLMPLPDRDFDVTEVAVPWHILTTAGHQVVFATERAGTVPAADPRLLAGVLLGRLGAAGEPRRFYQQLAASDEFGHTVSWAGLVPAEFDGLILPGGHAPGMRQYLSAGVLQEKAGEFWRLGRPVGAICHGVLVLARTRDPDTGRSILAGAGGLSPGGVLLAWTALATTRCWPPPGARHARRLGMVRRGARSGPSKAPGAYGRHHDRADSGAGRGVSPRPARAWRRVRASGRRPPGPADRGGTRRGGH